MVWTQHQRHLQLDSNSPSLADCIVERAHICETLLGLPVPESVWSVDGLMPSVTDYPQAYHHDGRNLDVKQRQHELFCGYRACVTVVSENAMLDFSSWVGHSVTLSWRTASFLLMQQLRHGIITQSAHLGSNQGMAAYRIIIEPALSQLRLNSHHRRFHHLSLTELIDQVMSDYDMVYALDDSLSQMHVQHATQYNQTDLSFFYEQLALFGITGYIEHDQDTHKLILLPHHHDDLAPPAKHIDSILHQNTPSLADTTDRVTHLRAKVETHIDSTSIHRYDDRHTDNYVGTSTSHQSAQGSQSSSHTRFVHQRTRMNSDGLNELASRYQKLHEQSAHAGELSGNLRHLHLPSVHVIDGNPFQREPISLMAIHHQINNHVPVDWLGSAPFDPVTVMPASSNQPKADAQAKTVHQVSCLFLPYPHHHHVPFQAQLARLGEPHPSITGLMSASVVDPNEQSVAIDRNHRVHVHYHWQEDDDQGDADHFVPVASHVVADHMGQTHPPRHGQQVLVDFVGGDINYPVIVGSIHNGQGNDNAQHNRHQSDSDQLDATSPVWFVNDTHAHPIDGIKTQSVGSSRHGGATKASDTSGYNQLMFDNHGDGGQIQAYSTASQSSLSLGNLYQHTDHQRGQPRGQGISLETKAAGLVKGAQGLLISTHAAGDHMAHHGHGALHTADQHQLAYQNLASTHQPVGLSADTTNTKAKEKNSTPYRQLSQQTNDQQLNQAGSWAAPHLIIGAAQHLAIVTGKHHQLNSTASTRMHATKSMHWHSQAQINQLVAGDIHYYSNQDQTHTAAHGDVTIQAHQKNMRLDAQKTLRIHSRDAVEIIAPETLTLTADGSSIEISNGKVTLTTPQQVGYKGSKVNWGSGGGAQTPGVSMPKGEMGDCPSKADSSTKNGGAV